MTAPRWLVAIVAAAVAAAAAVVLLLPDRTEAPRTAPATSAPATNPTGAPTSVASTSLSPDTAAPMHAQAVVYRTDQAVGGRFRVKITNTGDEPFEVLGVRLQSDGFEAAPLTTDPVRYAPGERTDIVTPYGTARCGDGDTVEPTAAVMDVRVADGSTQRYEVPLESIYDALPKLHERECDIARVAAAVDVGLASIEQVEGDDGPVLEADVTFRRLDGDEQIVVSDVRGSVLYRIVPGDLPVVMAPGDAEMRLPIVISAARCDGHALGESKQPFVFPVGIQIGDEDQVGYDIPMASDQQAQLWEYLTDTCGIVN